MGSHLRSVACLISRVGIFGHAGFVAALVLVRHAYGGEAPYPVAGVGITSSGGIPAISRAAVHRRDYFGQVCDPMLVSNGGARALV